MENETKKVIMSKQKKNIIRFLVTNLSYFQHVDGKKEIANIYFKYHLFKSIVKIHISVNITYFFLHHSSILHTNKKKESRLII